MKAVEAEKAVMLGNDIVIVLWKDNYLTICTDKSCYTTSKASETNKKLFYIIQAFYSDKRKVKDLI